MGLTELLEMIPPAINSERVHGDFSALFVEGEESPGIASHRSKLAKNHCVRIVVLSLKNAARPADVPLENLKFFLKAELSEAAFGKAAMDQGCKEIKLPQMKIYRPIQGKRNYNSLI